MLYNSKISKEIEEELERLNFIRVTNTEPVKIIDGCYPSFLCFKKFHPEVIFYPVKGGLLCNTSKAESYYIEDVKEIEQTLKEWNIND